jgi:hypothetical protein
MAAVAAVSAAGDRLHRSQLPPREDPKARTLG